MAALSISNPVASIPQIAPIPVAGEPPAAAPAAPVAAPLAGIAAPEVNPVQAAAAESQASDAEFSSAWKELNAPAPLTPVHNGGLSLTDQAKGLQQQLGAKLDTGPLGATDQYTLAWLNEQQGKYGDLGAVATPTTTVAPPVVEPVDPGVTDEMRKAWRAVQGGNMLVPGGGRGVVAGLTPEQRKVLEEEDAAEAKEQEAFNRRYAAYQKSLDNGQYA